MINLEKLRNNTKRVAEVPSHNPHTNTGSGTNAHHTDVRTDVHRVISDGRVGVQYARTSVRTDVHHTSGSVVVHRTINGGGMDAQRTDAGNRTHEVHIDYKLAGELVNQALDVGDERFIIDIIAGISAAKNGTKPWSPDLCHSGLELKSRTPNISDEIIRDFEPFRRSVSMSGRGNNCGYYAIESQISKQFSGNVLSSEGGKSDLDRADPCVEDLRISTFDGLLNMLTTNGTDSESANEILASAFGNGANPYSMGGMLQVEATRQLADKLLRPIVTIQRVNDGDNNPRGMIYVSLPRINIAIDGNPVVGGFIVLENDGALQKRVSDFFESLSVFQSFAEVLQNIDINIQIDQNTTAKELVTMLMLSPHAIALMNIGNHFHALQHTEQVFLN